MCTTCEWGSDEVKIPSGQQPRHAHVEHHHHHDGHQMHTHETETQLLQVEQDLLSKNNTYAAANRYFFSQRGVFVVNLMSSPGSGKTTLLVNTIRSQKTRYPIAVIEGDQQSSQDAERIRSVGVPGIQINTGKGCHLDAHMVGHALEQIAVNNDSVLFIENVGNLVFPAAFDLGETRKVVVMSVTEGEDKPLKYPDMFAVSDLMLINKIDLLPYLNFDIDLCIAYARRVNPNIEILRLSALNGDGCDAWWMWLSSGVDAARAVRMAAPSDQRA